ncbi:hypothetical protein EVAR_69754_1 [Eumeta japonica]|uniref:Uncharacterized protein n=1 Tax=Eumeta variegata TaxID=151549 RepID=A0A4C1SF02_EUMVA|nr:hypothetical protein EVAR_69754_1 [Eumeta japonica]
MISGKPITPTEDHVIGNGKSQTNGTAGNGTVVTEDITKSNVTASTATGGGTADNKGVTSSAQVSKQVVPGPTSASHVVIDEEKQEKGLCVVQ